MDGSPSLVLPELSGDQECVCFPADHESTLLNRLSTGDHSAFEQIYQEYAPIVHKFLAKRPRTKQATEDLVQEAFLRFWRDVRNFRRESQLKTYLLGIALRVHRENSFRDKPSLKLSPKPNGCGLCPRCPLSEPESAMCRRETKGRLCKRVDELLPRDRVALLMKFSLGESASKVSKLVLCTPNAQRKRLSRAYSTLATMLA